MGDGLFSSSGVVMLTGAAASSTSFSLGQDDSLWLEIWFSHTSWCSQLDKSFRDMVSITSSISRPFSFIIFIFVLLSCFQWFAFNNGWHYLEKPLFEVSSRGNLSRLRADYFQQMYLLYKHFSMTCFVSSVHILTCSRCSSLTTAFSFSN